MVSMDELFDARTAREFKSSLEKQFTEFRHAPSTVDGIERYKRSGSARKEYLVMCYGKGATISASHPLLKLCQSREVQDILKSYFETEPRLTALDYWLTLPAVQPARTGSQNWHRDHEDERLVKLFIYLSDVDEEAGPTEYIEGSFHGGPNDVLSMGRAFVLGDYLTSREDEMRRRGLVAFRRSMVGPKWTMVFINTSGIHRGGFGSKERAMANITFTSQASRAPMRFQIGKTHTGPETL